MFLIEKIGLDSVLPEVFAGEGALRVSEVWERRIVLERGRNYCVNAASGTGKTSLCSFLMGVRRDYLGKITFDGTDIREFGIGKWSALRSRNLAYVPQELELFESLSALDNVMLKNKLTDFYKEQEIRAMFERLEIDNRISTPVGRMSVGQRQRVALIRALCQPFDFLLLDEPVSHLDTANNRRCAELVAEKASAAGASVVTTSVGNPILLPGEVEELKL